MDAPIANDEEYRVALDELSRLIDLDPPEGSNDAVALEQLAARIAAYEKEHYPMEES